MDHTTATIFLMTQGRPLVRACSGPLRRKVPSVGQRSSATIQSKGVATLPSREQKGWTTRPATFLSRLVFAAAVRRSPSAGRSRRRLLDSVRALHALLGIEGNLYTTRLEVVGLASVLQEAGGVLEVAGVAELDSRRALAGVVPAIGDLVA